MNKLGPIVIIEDDLDDQELLSEVMKSLNYKNEIIFFSDGHNAIEYLNITNKEPFIILSNINMPKLNGFEIRDKIQNNKKLRLKCVPYLFFTTSDAEQSVIKAYSKSIQGFFVKSNSFEILRSTIIKIIEYWQQCSAPKYTRGSSKPTLYVVR